MRLGSEMTSKQGNTVSDANWEGVNALGNHEAAWSLDSHPCEKAVALFAEIRKIAAQESKSVAYLVA